MWLFSRVTLGLIVGCVTFALYRGFLASAWSLATLRGVVGPLRSCAGDCGGDGEVTVDEIIRLVNVALGTGSVGECPEGETDGDGEVTVTDIIRAVNAALHGCFVPPLVEALDYLARGDLLSASIEFGRAADADPNNEEVRLYAVIAAAAARIVDSQTSRSLISRAGGTLVGDSRSVCDLEATLPRPVAENAPTTLEVLMAAASELIPEVERVLAEVRRIPADQRIRFRLADLPECLRPEETEKTIIEIDRGDFLVVESGLEAILFLNDLLFAYDINVPLYTLLEDSARVVLDTHPRLLTLVSAGRLASARDHLRRAIERMVEAIDEISAEGDDQDDDVFVIDTDRRNEARKLRVILNLALDALSREVNFPINVVTGEVDLLDVGLGESERLNLDPLFSGQFTTLRPLLPGFDSEGNFDTGLFPDPTFGGMAPDMTQWKINHFFEGGPRCAVCFGDEDCDAWGFGSYYCGYCYGDGCTGERRCVDGYTECGDRTFY